MESDLRLTKVEIARSENGRREVLIRIKSWSFREQTVLTSSKTWEAGRRLRTGTIRKSTFISYIYGKIVSYIITSHCECSSEKTQDFR